MTVAPGLVGAAMLLVASGLWMHSADKGMREVLDKSTALRRSLQTDPAATLASACTAQGTALVGLGKVALPPWRDGWSGSPFLTCSAEIKHRKGPKGRAEGLGQPGPDSMWQAARCGAPAGRPPRLEPVRFRQIRVCCQRGKGPCLFDWRFFMKS